MEWDTLLGPVVTGIQEVITDVTPLGVGIFVTLAGISLAIGLFRKFGVKR